MTDVLILLGPDIVRRIGLDLSARELYKLCNSSTSYVKVCTPSFLEKYFLKSYPESYKPKDITWGELLEVWSNYLNPQFVYNGVSKDDIIKTSIDRLIGYLEDEIYENIKDYIGSMKMYTGEYIIIQYVFLIYSMDKSGNENSHQVIIIYRRPEMNETSAYIVDAQTQEIKDLPLSGMILKIDDRKKVQKELSIKLNKILLLFASNLNDELASVSEIYDERYKEFEPLADAAIRKIDLLETKPSKKIYDRLSKDITVLIDQSKEFIYGSESVSEELKVALLVLKAKYSDEYDEFMDILDGLKIDVDILSFAKKISKKEYDALKKDHDELISLSGRYIVLFVRENEKSVISRDLDLLGSILKKV